MRGRFAPSPTGRLHLGNVRSALLGWLQARTAGGQFLLRIEDLDPDRSREEHVDGLYRDLGFLGLDWDGEVWRQSRRRAVYEEALARLEAQGRVYACTCSRAEIARAASAPHVGEEGPIYPGTCRPRASGPDLRDQPFSPSGVEGGELTRDSGQRDWPPFSRAAGPSSGVEGGELTRDSGQRDWPPFSPSGVEGGVPTSPIDRTQPGLRAPPSTPLDGAAARLNGRSPHLSGAPGLRGARPASLRFRVDEGTVSFIDGVRGPCTQDVAHEVGDFVVRRTDGVASYQLAVVVDDALSGVTDVLRGDDLLSSTARQLVLYRALGFTAPRFAHVPLLLQPDGKRLAKREGSTTVAGLREAGVPAEAIIGLLAKWSGLGDGAPVRARELLVGFSLDRVRRTPTIVHDDELAALIRSR